jgi:orotate phosphoribosyltransferase
MSDDLLRLFQQRGALLEGHFLLSSGLHSPRYLQCARVLMDPPLATGLGAELAERLGALGARALFTEREGGRMTLRRGFELGPADTVVVVEDVVTTGGSTREVIEAVQARGARVLAAAALVDRSGGGAAALPVPLHSLLRVEVPTYTAEDCPLCAAGSPAVKPGSR